MQAALVCARKAAERNEVPVGCVITSPSGIIIAQSHNEVLERKDPTAHAEILALRAASLKRRSERLTGCDLYVTLEPCTMCAAAISLSRIRRVYFGASDPKCGAIESGIRFFQSPCCFHAPAVYGGFGEREACSLLKRFFSVRR
ncbi:MAG: nucleoside deaminase [Alphaproteobacteria bacterium]|nr:nucleoside deaminase [Alphaproteobacteria bacterium]